MAKNKYNQKSNERHCCDDFLIRWLMACCWATEMLIDFFINNQTYTCTALCVFDFIQKTHPDDAPHNFHNHVNPN